MTEEKKILFLHGFYASGDCELAATLREAFDGRAVVLTPDLPVHPREAILLIRDIIDSENPDLLVGNSCGAFYAQMLAPVVGIPALLGNPHFRMSDFLSRRKGTGTFKSTRLDGKQTFKVDDDLINEFAELESAQFDYRNPFYNDRVWGLFGERDTLAHFESLFLEHYSQTFHFPGGHTPTAAEALIWYVPLAERMLKEYPMPEDGARYFRHFKGGNYRFIRTAFDSENRERMVIYQALYGARQYWVRPERAFFENITRDNKRFARFTEIDKNDL